jgi:hypothetical protein
LAFELDDLNMAKSVIDYSVSVNICFLVEGLTLHERDTDVYNYVWNHQLKKYDPNELLKDVANSHRFYEDNPHVFYADSPRVVTFEKLFKRMLRRFKDDIRLNYMKVYKASEKYRCGQKYVRRIMREKYGDDEYDNWLVYDYLF